MVALLQPRGQSVIEPVEGEDLTGADFAFQLALGGLEEAFDQSAGRRIAHAAVEQAGVQGEASRLQCVSVINLGVVQIQFAAGSVNGPGPQQRVDEDVQVFPQVVAGLNHVAAVAVDEGREVGRHRLVAYQHARPILEIAQPQGVGMVPRPAAADLLLTDAQLQPCGPGPLQVPIESRFGNRRLELGLEELVDGDVGAARLLLLQFNGLGDHRLRTLARLSPVAPSPAEQGLETAIAVLFPLPPQGGPRWPPTLPVGEDLLAPRQLLQKATGLFRRNFPVEQRTQQRTPENGPPLFPIGHRRRSFPHV